MTRLKVEGPFPKGTLDKADKHFLLGLTIQVLQGLMDARTPDGYKVIDQRIRALESLRCNIAETGDQ